MTEHPSFLALDILAAGGADESTQRHVDSCERCRAHVARVRTAEAAPPSLLVRAKEDVSPRQRLRWAWPVITSTLAAVLLAVVLVPRVSERDAEAIRSKGFPSVALYVKHGEEVRLWDGASPVAEGDRLRLKVHPAGFRYVWVGLVSAQGQQTLFTGEVNPSEPALLPDSWRVEGNAPSETLRIVLGDDAHPEDDANDSRAWRSDITIPRSTPRVP